MQRFSQSINYITFLRMTNGKEPASLQLTPYPRFLLLYLFVAPGIIYSVINFYLEIICEKKKFSFYLYIIQL
jgi:hypothetical protein